MPSKVKGPDRSSILAQAPCRADLAGGTLDLWPLYLFHPGSVTLNFAVTVMTSCRITPIQGKRIELRSLDTRKEDTFANFDQLLASRSPKHLLAAKVVEAFQPENGFILETRSESPAGAGISGSSALMIATTAALAKFTGRTLSLEQMRQFAQNVEAQIIKVPTGCQDYYPALYGGVNAIHLEPEGIWREALPISAAEIDRRFVVAYTGAPRQSGINNWQVFKAHIDGNSKVQRNFQRISEIAKAMYAALTTRDWEQVSELLRDEWKLRKSNYKGISTPLIDRLVQISNKNGGVAAKVCGAGGGGCVLFMVREGARDRVENVLRKSGAQILPCRVSESGLSVSYNDSAQVTHA